MGWIYVERTMTTMGGMIGMINAVSSVKRSRSRASPGSRGITSPRCCRARRTLRQHRRGWAGGLYRCQKAFLHRLRPYVSTHMPAARLDRTNWHYGSPRWKHGIGRSALAAVWAQDRRRRYSKRLCLRNQPLETQRWIRARIIRNQLSFLVSSLGGRA